MDYYEDVKYNTSPEKEGALQKLWKTIKDLITKIKNFFKGKGFRLVTEIDEGDKKKCEEIKKFNQKYGSKLRTLGKIGVVVAAILGTLLILRKIKKTGKKVPISESEVKDFQKNNDDVLDAITTVAEKQMSSKPISNDVNGDREKLAPACKQMVHEIEKTNKTLTTTDNTSNTSIDRNTETAVKSTKKPEKQKIQKDTNIDIDSRIRNCVSGYMRSEGMVKDNGKKYISNDTLDEIVREMKTGNSNSIDVVKSKVLDELSKKHCEVIENAKFDELYRKSGVNGNILYNVQKFVNEYDGTLTKSTLRKWVMEHELKNTPPNMAKRQLNAIMERVSLSSKDLLESADDDIIYTKEDIYSAIALGIIDYLESFSIS